MPLATSNLKPVARATSRLQPRASAATRKVNRFNGFHSFLKTVCWLWLLALGLQSAWAFSLIGPNNEAYQIPTIGYNPLPSDPLPTGPKNLGEEYRRNMPVLYYSFDANFLDYFGASGVSAVDQAMSIMNGITNVSQYSRDLFEFPFDSKRYNYQAQALSLLDLRSETLHLMLEQIGLAEPVRYTWALHDRAAIPNAPACPDGMAYSVIKRNFDPVPSPLDQFWPSSYVNGTLYSYVILEACTGPPPLADAVEFSVDPLARVFTPVAENALENGGFYLSLTRDDVGGMRYLLQTNNMNIESSGPGTVEFVTNNNNAQILVSSNLTLLAAQALTNNAAALQALYPGLVISSSSNSFAVVWTTNLFPYFTNFPWSPPFVGPTLAFATNITPSVQTLFHHAFANIVTFQFINGNWVAVPITDFSSVTGHVFNTIQTTVVTNSPWSVPGGTNGINTVLVTNNFTRIFATNAVIGDFFILPPNLCDVAIIAPILTNVIAQTNILFSATNSATNLLGGTNFQSFTQSRVDFFTNHVFVIYGVSCPSNTVALRQGIEHITFVRRDFDSLLGRFFYPITNNYILNEITNSTLEQASISRSITQPDFLFSAADLADGPGAFPPAASVYARNVNFNTANAYPGLAGPGTIEPSTTVIFNKVGPIYLNYRLDPFRFLDEVSQIPILIWGSFDGTTNPPVVYPNGASIENLENQVLMPISPDVLPDGTIGQPYSAQFSAQGGQPPYSWALAPGSPGLPPGLALSPDGLISGTPTSPATFDFVIRMTDAAGRFVDRPYSIRINP